MSRKHKEKQVESTSKVEETQEVQLLDLRKALNLFKMENPEKAVHMKDYKIIELYAVKHIPDLKASKEIWDQVLNKF